VGDALLEPGPAEDSRPIDDALDFPEVRGADDDEGDRR
jgi:hypothetical protein